MLTSSVSCSNKVSCGEVQGPPPGIPSVELPLGEPTPEEEKPKAVAREGRLPEPKIKKPPIFEKPTVESLKINCGSTKAGVGVSKVSFGGYTDVRKVYEDYPDIANVVKASSKSDALNQINYYYICSDDRCEKTYKICSDPLITTLPENDNMVVSSKCSFSVTCSEISEQPTIPVLRTEQEIPPFTPSFWPSGPAPAGEGETSGKEFYTPYCGDFKKDLGEDCDPPGSVSVDGKFICGSDCQWFVSSIVGVPGQVYGPLPQPVCGNGVKEGAEVCDGSVGCASGQSCSNDCKSCFTPAISLPSAPPVCEEGEDVRYCVCNMFNSLGHCCPANTYWNGVQCAAYLAGGPTIIGAPPTPTYTYARVVANLFSATGKSIMSFTGMQSFAAKGEGAGRQVLDPACAPTVLMSRVKEVECSVGETKLEKGWVWDTCYECVKTPLWPAQWRSTDMSRCEGQKPPEKEVEKPRAPLGERPPERRSPTPLGELPGRPGSGLLPLEGSECSEGDIKCESEDGGCYYQTCVNGKFTSKDYVSTSCEEFLPGRVCSSKTIKPQTSPPGERPSPPPAPKEEPRGLPLSGEPAERRVSDEKVCKNGATRKCKIVKGTEGAVCNYEVCKKNQWVYDSVVIPPDVVYEEYCSC
ncbi:hypothetical protein HYV79_02870 [Candidatus Woesearchaeota archaeon]|nr:hypothetical protein [Candidatus Woesearchaeota archaeon]